MASNASRCFALAQPLKIAALVALTAAALTLVPGIVGAGDDKDHDRTRFYGWVEAMPEGLHGTWIIGGQQVTTGPSTEFDQLEGPLQVGACAKVTIRGGVIHEIDSEPPGDCR